MNGNRSGAADSEDLERLRGDVNELMDKIGDVAPIEVIVGIPFYDEDDTLPGVVDTARAGLKDLGLTGKSAIVCVGPSEHDRDLKRALKRRSRNRIPTIGFGHTHGVEGHGWALRTILEVAARCNAALVVLRPNLVAKGGDDGGFASTWIEYLLRPVREQGQALALARFNRHTLSHPVDSLITYPVLAEVFAFRLRQPTPGVMALSATLAQSFSSSSGGWPAECGVYGFDTWMVTRTIETDQPICEVPLGDASFRHGAGRLKLAFRQVVHTLMHEIVGHADWWPGRDDVIAAPNQIAGIETESLPPASDLDPSDLFRRFKMEFDHFDDTLFRELLPDELRRRMERLSDRGPNELAIGAEEWPDIVNRFILAYRFDKRFHRDDVLDGLFPLFLARLAGFIAEVHAITDVVPQAGKSRKKAVRSMIRVHTERLIEQQTDIFVKWRSDLRREWHQRSEEAAPYLPRLGSWEFVPNVGVVVPQELEKPDGGIVWANQIYQELLDRYRSEFMGFLRGQLGLTQVENSATVLTRIHRFMKELENAIEGALPHDLTSVEGAGAMTEFVFERFSRRPVLQLTSEAAHEILAHVPPNGLIMHLGCRDVGGLLAAHAASDALAMASWTERRLFLERVLDTLAENADASWFCTGPLKPVVVGVEFLADPTELRGIRALARLAGRLIVGNFQKGWGGEYPNLWYLLQLVFDVVAAEVFSEIWESHVAESTDFSRRLVKALRSAWGRNVTSAHNILKNRHQRILVERLQDFAQYLTKDGAKSVRAGRLLKAAAEVYNLSITLPDATFVPLSAWTWTSYSYRGGLGSPTPLSSLVERDWASADFLTEYLKQAGLGDESSIYRKVIQMVVEGREFDDVSHELLGVPKERFVIPQAPTAHREFAKKLVRQLTHPILEPIPEHDWENRYVLNTGVVRVDGTVYLLYRAFGTDKISRIGLAWTRDGIHIDGRLEQPIFEPANPTESAGCEDPRITIIGNDMYMLYTAFDGKVAQIAMASIAVDAFLDQRFDTWKRHGLGFPGLPNKDAVLYPETFDGRYVIYHRLDPSLWVSYLDNLECPWPRTGQKIVTGPRPGMMWDGIKIGAGAQPIKTTKGWLNIYHGVDYEHCYRLGVLFMDLEDPTRIIYQSPNAILEPEFDFEIGNVEGRDYWVPKVVFTCGAVPALDKDIIGPDDEILVYYGAADTAIGVAKGMLRDLVPGIAGPAPVRIPSR